MKRTLLLILFVSLFTACSYAGDQSWYIGGSIGQTDFDSGVTNLTGTAKMDEEDTGYTFFVGLKATDNVAFEVSYADFGEFSLSGNNGDNFTIAGEAWAFTANNVNIAMESSGFTFSVLGSLPVHERIAPFARLGVNIWEMKAASDSTTAGSLEDDGTDIYYGGGIDFEVIKSISIRTEYSQYLFDDDDLSMLSVGLIYYLPIE